MKSNYFKCGHEKTKDNTYGIRSGCKKCLITRNKEYQRSGKADKSRQKALNKRIIVDGKWFSPLVSEHGVRTTSYRYYGCRCDLCFDFDSKRRKEIRDKKKNKEIQERKNDRILVHGRLITTRYVKHGKISTHTKFFCECVPCLKAAGKFY